MTLGLRPQAMEVAMVNKKHSGLFIRRKDTAITVLQRASLVEDVVSDLNEQVLNHRALSVRPSVASTFRSILKMVWSMTVF